MSMITQHDLEDAFHLARSEFSKELAELRREWRDGPPSKVQIMPGMLEQVNRRLNALETAMERAFGLIEQIALDR